MAYQTRCVYGFYLSNTNDKISKEILEKQKDRIVIYRCIITFFYIKLLKFLTNMI
jgi:hypothetical protein